MYILLDLVQQSKKCDRYSSLSTLPCLTHSLQVPFFSFPCNSLLLLRQCYNIPSHLHTKKVLVLRFPPHLPKKYAYYSGILGTKCPFILASRYTRKLLNTKSWKTGTNAALSDLLADLRNLRTLSKRQT